MQDRACNNEMIKAFCYPRVQGENDKSTMCNLKCTKCVLVSSPLFMLGFEWGTFPGSFEDVQIQIPISILRKRGSRQSETSAWRTMKDVSRCVRRPTLAESKSD